MLKSILFAIGFATVDTVLVIGDIACFAVCIAGANACCIGCVTGAIACLAFHIIFFPVFVLYKELYAPIQDVIAEKRLKAIDYCLGAFFVSFERISVSAESFELLFFAPYISPNTCGFNSSGIQYIRVSIIDFIPFIALSLTVEIIAVFRSDTLPIFAILPIRRATSASLAAVPDIDLI